MNNTFRPGSLANHALQLGTGTVIGQGAAMLASPIWSRLYEPADFGRIGLVLAFIAVTSVGVALRFDMAIPQAKNRVEAARLLFLCLVLLVPTSIFAACVYAALSALDLFGFGALPSWSAVLIAPLLATTGAFTALRFWHVRSSGFKTIARSLVAQGIGRALTPIVLGTLHIGWLGLLAGEAAGRVLGFRRLAMQAVPIAFRSARRASFADLRNLASRYRSYPLVFLPSAVLDSIGAAVAIPVLVALHGVSASGQFLLAQQVALVPAALLAAALSDVYHSRLARTARVEPENVSKQVVVGGARLLLLSAAIYIPAAIVAPFLAVPVFGADWDSVGRFVSVLVPAAMAAVCVGPLGRALLLSKIPHIKFVADIAKIVLPITGLVVGDVVATDKPFGSVIGFSIGTLFSYAIYFAVIVRAVRLENLRTFPSSQEV